MIGLLCFVLAVLASPFKSKLRLEAENAVLRHQLIVLKRRLHGRVRLTNHDRWFLIQGDRDARPIAFAAASVFEAGSDETLASPSIDGVRLAGSRGRCFA
jgi:hypothetical protein